MKNLVPILLLSLYGCSHTKPAPLSESGLSSNEVPAQIQTAFQKNYPGITPEYYLEKKPEGNLYEADFKVGEKAVFVTFKPSGEIKQIEKEIDLKQLAPPVQKNVFSQLKSIYDTDEILASETIEKRSPQLSKEIQIKIQSSKSPTDYYIVYFSLNGKHLRAEEWVVEPIITLH